jgi:RNA polymerase sigma-70 factor (ECF subfamily)
VTGSADIGDDAALVAQVLSGDTGAYAILMRRHFPVAFATARRLTATPEDAEDACQEAFARAYFRLAECGEPARFLGWTLQIVRHHAHNVRRYQALRAALSLDELPAAAAASMTTHGVESADLRQHLHRALGTLSPVKRAVVQHHDLDGWTHPQIARALGISVLMSRRHLSDARARLRTVLGEIRKDFNVGELNDD